MLVMGIIRLISAFVLRGSIDVHCFGGSDNSDGTAA
jgi:hypothetical protein